MSFSNRDDNNTNYYDFDLESEDDFKFESEDEFDFSEYDFKADMEKRRKETRTYRITYRAQVKQLNEIVSSTIWLPFWMTYEDYAVEMDLIFKEAMDEIFHERSLLKQNLLIDLYRIYHQEEFRSVFPELIAEAMHPRRMMKRMNQFEDIEAFFNNI
ncbi:unnamed protein product [Phytophthora lilii]|uniref:Unnamed protein product n=1 Tax=Phytophthora lilii TaxID=2077276 RepID=A0A9W6WW12_9STRA|nr:unnamed protein product [Phytophthora lilii]